MVPGALFSLVISNTYGDTIVDSVFTVADRSLPITKLSGVLAGQGVGTGQVLKWNGSTWVPSTLSSLTYVGTWNANTNTPDVTLLSPTNGSFYIVSNGGTTSLSGISTWTLGDWLVYNGSTWERIQSAVTVNSVHGRQGVVVAQANDYTWAQIDKTISSIGDIADVSISGVLNGDVLKYDNATGKWVPSAVVGVTGATGPQGPIGNTGSQGTQGIQGPQGLTGAAGTNGTNGSNGVQGIQGLTGLTGPQGTQGVQGTTGNTGASGILVLQAGATINGVTYPADTSTTLQTSVAPLAVNLTDVVNVGYLSNYVSNASLSTTLSGYVTSAGLTTSLSGYATTGALSTQATTTATNLTNGLATKEPLLANPNDATKYYRGDKTWANFATDAVSALTSTLSSYALNSSLSTTNGNVTALTTSLGTTNTNLTNLANTVSGLTTSSVAEGSNLYYTDARAVNALNSTLSGYVTFPSMATALTSYALLTDLTTTNSALSSSVAGKLNLTGGVLTGDLYENTKLQLRDASTVGNANYVALKANDTTAVYTFTLPINAGTSGQVLKTDGTGITSWYSIPAPDLSAYTNTAGVNTLIATQASTDAANLSSGLATKEPIITSGSTGQYIRGDKTLSTFATDAVSALSSTLSSYATTANLSTTNANVSNLSTSLSSLSTTSVSEGSNLYFTETRAIDSILSSFVIGANSKIANTDKIVSAFNKTQGQIDAVNSTLTTNATTMSGHGTSISGHSASLANDASSILQLQTDVTAINSSIITLTSGLTTANTNIAGKEPIITNPNDPTKYYRGDKSWGTFLTDTMNSLLTGLSVGTNSIITAGDNLLAALGKLQAQITSLGVAVSGHSASIATQTTNIATNTSNISLANTAIGLRSLTTDITQSVTMLNLAVTNINGVLVPDLSTMVSTAGFTMTGQIISNTTNATSTTTGAITIPGGIGISQDAWIGGLLSVGTRMGVGLGVGSPVATLDINGSDSATGVVLNIKNSSLTSIFNVQNDGTINLGGALIGDALFGNSLTTASTTIQAGPGYVTGLASQTTTTITGTGTPGWTSAMTGSTFIFADGTNAGTVTYVSPTILTSTVSQTVASQAYQLGGGIKIGSKGTPINGIVVVGTIVAGGMPYNQSGGTGSAVVALKAVTLPIGHGITTGTPLFCGYAISPTTSTLSTTNYVKTFQPVISGTTSTSVTVTIIINLGSTTVNITAIKCYVIL
jgi:hypothetical protein